MVDQNLRKIFLPYCRNMLNISTILQVLVLGQPGEEISLELILRVVADVGLVVSIALYLFMHVYIGFSCIRVLN